MKPPKVTSLSEGKFLIPLEISNKIVLLRRAWEPFSGGANGLSCPDCGGELFDELGRQGGLQRDPVTYYTSRNVKCQNPKCSFKGKREIE